MLGEKIDAGFRQAVDMTLRALPVAVTGIDERGGAGMPRQQRASPTSADLKIRTHPERKGAEQ